MQLLMWRVSIIVVAAYSRGNIWRTIKHPMLVGVKIWALAHLISNGDLGSIVLFASFLVRARYDRLTPQYPTHPRAPPVAIVSFRGPPPGRPRGPGAVRGLTVQRA